jgi:hypothetical protein
MGLLQNIKAGWFNYIKSSINKKSLSAELRLEVESRAKICTTCPELKLISKNIAGPLQGRCGKCGCAFPAMIFAPNKVCPIGKWGKLEP